MPADETRHEPVFGVLLAEAFEALRQTAAPKLLDVAVSKDLEVAVPYDDGPFAGETVRSSVRFRAGDLEEDTLDERPSALRSPKSRG